MGELGELGFMKSWRDVPGFNDNMDIYDLFIEKLPQKAKYLEMGVFYGRGIIYLAQNSDFEIFGVDQFIKDGIPNHPAEIENDSDFYETCVRNIEPYHGQIVLLRKTSEEAAKMIDDLSLDCVYLDGNHAYESIARDIELWVPKVKDGGIVAGDDYIEPWGGVIKAVDEAWPNRELVGQSWWVQL